MVLKVANFVYKYQATSIATNIANHIAYSPGMSLVPVIIILIMLLKIIPTLPAAHAKRKQAANWLFLELKFLFCLLAIATPINVPIIDEGNANPKISGIRLNTEMIRLDIETS